MGVEVIKHARAVVRVTGEIDIANVAELESALDQAVEESPDGFVVDTSEVEYIDATGIKAILRAWDRMHSGGGAVALVVSKIVRKIADLLGLEKLPCLLLFESLDAALNALTRGAGDQR